MVVNKVGLKGGKTGTSPQLIAEVLREYSPYILFDPIDDNFLKKASSAVNVLVKVNGLLSVCTSDCSYSFKWDVPALKSLTRTNSRLYLSISSSSYSYNLGDISIIFNGNYCPFATGSSISDF